MNDEREITREELYKLVWSKSLVLAAQELGISDVGLAKICKRLDVPGHIAVVGGWKAARKLRFHAAAGKDTRSAFFSCCRDNRSQMTKRGH